MSFVKVALPFTVGSEYCEGCMYEYSVARVYAGDYCELFCTSKNAFKRCEKCREAECQ